METWLHRGIVLNAQSLVKCLVPRSSPWAQDQPPRNEVTAHFGRLVTTMNTEFLKFPIHDKISDAVEIRFNLPAKFWHVTISETVLYMSQLNFFLWKGHLHCMQWDGLPVKADISRLPETRRNYFFFLKSRVGLFLGSVYKVTKVSTASNDQTKSLICIWSKVPRQAKNKNIILPNIYWWLSHNPRLIGSSCLSVYY